MAEDGSLDSIFQNGLRSTTALLDLFEISGEERRPIESERRPKPVTVHHPAHGRAVIRDNQPFQEGRMRGRMVGMTFPEWYEHLNGRVFFWVTPNRLNRFMGAYANAPHLIFKVDTSSVLESHLERISVSAMNTGATNFVPPKRGVGTFLSLDRHPYYARRKRGLEPVVEVTVEYSVPDILDHVLEVERHSPDGSIAQIWPSG